jgi:hypothetical protein
MKENITKYPIPDHRKEMYDYYRLSFDKDGCPMKELPNKELIFHPILPPYLIVDYVLMYEKTRDESWIRYATQIANLSLRKGEVFNNSLVFYYHPESGLSSVPKKFYSALTQAWYVKAICALNKYRANSFIHELKLIFESLLIPLSNDGVLVKKKYGWTVEEYPYSPPFYTLNGWLTVIRWIIQSSHILDNYSINYELFVEKNLDAIEHLLPLYDAKFCLNSRYQLTGFTRIKFVLEKAVNYKIENASISIPEEGTFECNLTNNSNKSRWHNYLERSESRIIQFNTVLSLISFPAKNSFNARIDLGDDVKLKIFLAQGYYNPDSTGMPTKSWKEIGNVCCKKGINNISINIPFDEINLFAYPTNFKKYIGGKKYNGYHFVHIIDLGELYRYSKRKSFKETALKWMEYYNQWESLPVLEGFEKHHYLYREKFEAFIMKEYFTNSYSPKITQEGC